MDINRVRLDRRAIDKTIKLLSEARDNGADEVVLFEYITGCSDDVKATIIKGDQYDYQTIILYEEEDKQEKNDGAQRDEPIDLDE